MLDRHPLFEAYRDPHSGVVSYLLKNPFGKPLSVPYFSVKSFTPDENILFGYLRHGPMTTEGFDGSALSRETIAESSLFLLDLERGEIKVSENSANYPSAFIDDRRGLLFYTRDNSLWTMDLKDFRERCWFTLPSSISGQGRRVLFGTHLTMSCDGRRILLDGRYGVYTFLGVFDVEEMRFEIVADGRRTFFDHGMYSPADPHLAYFAHEWWLDPDNGDFHPIDHRIWLVRTDDGCPPWPLPQPQGYNVPKNVHGQTTHEWWAPDGTALYSILHEYGIARIDVATGSSELVWQGGCCHGMCDASQRYFVVDQNTYLDKPRSVLFIDRQTGQTRMIAQDMPRPPEVFNRYYHLDPHPQFSPKGSFILYNGTMTGIADFCLCPVDQLRN